MSANEGTTAYSHYNTDDDRNYLVVNRQSNATIKGKSGILFVKGGARTKCSTHYD